MACKWIKGDQWDWKPVTIKDTIYLFPEDK